MALRRCFLLGLGLGSADAFAIGGTGLMRASRLMSMSAAKRAPLDGAVETAAKAGLFMGDMEGCIATVRQYEFIKNPLVSLLRAVADEQVCVCHPTNELLQCVFIPLMSSLLWVVSLLRAVADEQLTAIDGATKRAKELWEASPPAHPRDIVVQVLSEYGSQS